MAKKLKDAAILYIVISGFALGIAFVSFFPLGVSGGMFFALLGAVVGFFSRAAKQGAVALVAVGMLSFGLGVAWMSWADTRDYALESFVGEKIIVEGVIDDEPDVRENSALLTFLPERVISGITPPSLASSGHLPLAGEEITFDEKVLLTTERVSQIQYGDRVLVEGNLRVPENFETENGREFDYVSYLAKGGVHYQMLFPKITLVAHSEGNWMKERLLIVKSAFTDSINRAIPEPEAGLLAGILLGAKHSLPKDLLEDFRTVGLVHIVVLSGYNITLVVDWTMRALGFLPRIYGLVAGSAFTFLFVLMTGANAATVRAGIMAIIVLMARHMGREAESVRLLFFVAFLMIMWSPAALLSDPSFQLSVVATFGLLAFSPKISGRLTFLPEKSIFRSITSDTLATQLAVLPLLLWMTGAISLAALPANLLVLPAVPPAMLFGFITGLFGFADSLSGLFGILAFPFALIAHMLLSYIFLIAQFFSGLPFASVSISW